MTLLWPCFRLICCLSRRMCALMPLLSGEGLRLLCPVSSMLAEELERGSNGADGPAKSSRADMLPSKVLLCQQWLHVRSCAVEQHLRCTCK